MKKSPKSAAELLIEKEISCMEDIISHSKVEVDDARLLIYKAIKIWEKCEDLRKSRDNWKNKYEKLKNDIQT